MTNRISQMRTLGRACSGVIGLLSIGITIAPEIRAQFNSPAHLEFEVASIKSLKPAPVNYSRPVCSGNRFVSAAAPMPVVAFWAYGGYSYQYSGWPTWLESEIYEIIAKGEAPIGEDKCKLMVQELLAKRFKLALRREIKQLAVYELVIARSGPKLQDVARADAKQR